MDNIILKKVFGNHWRATPANWPPNSGVSFTRPNRDDAIAECQRFMAEYPAPSELLDRSYNEETGEWTCWSRQFPAYRITLREPLPFFDRVMDNILRSMGESRVYIQKI